LFIIHKITPYYFVEGLQSFIKIYFLVDKLYCLVYNLYCNISIGIIFILFGC